MKCKKHIILIIAAAVLLIFSIVCFYMYSKYNTCNKYLTKDNKEISDLNKENKNLKAQNSKDETYKNALINYQNKELKIPILMYHYIEDKTGDPYAELGVPKDKFEKEMQIVKDSGYTPVSLDELYDFMENKKPFTCKPVLITMDDGYRDFYNNAYPVLKKFNFKATVFQITDVIDGPAYLTKDQIVELSKSGLVDIESHTGSHKELATLPYNVQYDELKRSKEKLEQITGKKIYYIAYPSGSYNSNTLEIDKKLGYRLALTTKEGFASKNDNFYELKRIYVSNNYDLNQFKKIINY